MRKRPTGAPICRSTGIDQIYGEIYARLRLGVPAIAGVVNVLDRIDLAGIPFCVASNGSEEKMSITLGHTRSAFSVRNRDVFRPYAGCRETGPGIVICTPPTHSASLRSSVPLSRTVSAVLPQPDGPAMKCYGYSAHDDGAGLAEAGADVFHDMAELAGLLGI